MHNRYIISNHINVQAERRMPHHHDDLLQHQPIETARGPVSRSSSSGFRGPGLSRKHLPAGYAASLQAL